MKFLLDQIIAWKYEELNNFSNLKSPPKENSERKERILLNLQSYKLLRKHQNSMRKSVVTRSLGYLMFIYCTSLRKAVSGIPMITHI